jgi:hypothetical protein
MSKLDLTEQHARECAGFAARAPSSTSRDDTRDHADHRVLYVLGFGIAGAIVTNALVALATITTGSPAAAPSRKVIYFAMVYASG